MKKMFIALAICFGWVGVTSAQVALGPVASGPGSIAHMAYVGVDYDFMTLQIDSASASGGIPEGHYFGDLVDFRAGVRILKALGVEAHVGLSANGNHHGDHFKFRHYYGLFAVPTATLFNTVELSVPLGYVWTGAKAGGAKTTFNSAAFGANLELPIQVLFPDFPDVRLTGGGIVSVQRSNAQIYGFHVGLRYDFGLGRF